MPCSLLRLALLSCIICLATTACGNIKKDPYTQPDHEISADLGNIPQDLTFFAKKVPAGSLASPEYLAEASERALNNFFAPWEMKRSGSKPKDALWAAYSLKREKGFMENQRPYSEERWSKLINNCNLEAFPNRSIRAITVQRTDLRLLPTSRPYFFHPGMAGQGYPFDYLQNSALPVGTPVFISHISRDLAWAFVESVSVSGWVNLRNIAYADDNFIKEWRAAKLYAVIVEDALFYRTKSGENSVKQTIPAAKVKKASTPKSRSAKKQAATKAKPAKPVTTTKPKLPATVVISSIGTLLPSPITDQDNNAAKEFYLPERDAYGNALIRRYQSNAGDTAAWPMPFTAENMATLGNRMLGQPYGWGGYTGNRDCSAMLRELFLSFGMWLPRNSSRQIKVGETFDISALSAKAKEKSILESALPFASLIGMPGHIALYVGEHEGRAVMFHNMWGLRIKVPGEEQDGRAVVGKAVITTLTPGKERSDIARPNSLLDVTNAFNIIGYR